MQQVDQLYDLDHVVLSNGKIYRVLGNVRSNKYFWGYNVYSPQSDGDRFYRGMRYRKNYPEDEQLPHDVLDTYEVLNMSDVVAHCDPVQSARQQCSSFEQTIWFDLYTTLKEIFGEDAIGIFGSSMFGLHLTPEGRVRKDVDFVIEGLDHLETLRDALPDIRRQLGFEEVSAARQLQQYQRYQKVFQNHRNSIQEIIKRRWTGLQLSEQIVSTLRFREKHILLPLELVDDTVMLQRNVVVSGHVIDADKSHLFPRMFTLSTKTYQYPVYILWWKFSTPVCLHDRITLCGDRILLEGQEAIRMTNFHKHWMAFDA